MDIVRNGLMEAAYIYLWSGGSLQSVCSQHVKGCEERLPSDSNTRRPLSQVADLTDCFLFALAARKFSHLY